MQTKLCHSVPLRWVSPTVGGDKASGHRGASVNKGNQIGKQEIKDTIIESTEKCGENKEN